MKIMRFFDHTLPLDFFCLNSWWWRNGKKMKQHNEKIFLVPIFVFAFRLWIEILGTSPFWFEYNSIIVLVIWAYGSACITCFMVVAFLCVSFSLHSTLQIWCLIVFQWQWQIVAHTLFDRFFFSVVIFYFLYITFLMRAELVFVWYLSAQQHFMNAYIYIYYKFEITTRQNMCIGKCAISWNTQSHVRQQLHNDSKNAKRTCIALAARTPNHILPCNGRKTNRERDCSSDLRTRLQWNQKCLLACAWMYWNCMSENEKQTFRVVPLAKGFFSSFF